MECIATGKQPIPCRGSWLDAQALRQVFKRFFVQPIGRLMITQPDRPEEHFYRRAQGFLRALATRFRSDAIRLADTMRHPALARSAECPPVFERQTPGCENSVTGKSSRPSIQAELSEAGKAVPSTQSALILPMGSASLEIQPHTVTSSFLQTGSGRRSAF